MRKRQGCTSFWLRWSFLLLLPGLVGLVLNLSRESPAWAGLAISTRFITSTYFGATGNPSANEKIVDLAHTPDGSIVIIGTSSLPDPTFPTASPRYAYGPASASGTSGFVARFDADGHTLLWYAYFTPQTALPNRVAVDNAGNIYLAGIAYQNFAGLMGSLPPSCNQTLSGSADPFVAKLNPDGNALLWASYASGDDDLAQVQLGLASDNGPVISGRSGQNFFITRFGASGGCGFNQTYGDPLNSSAYSYINGLTLAPASNGIYAVGYHQRSANLQVPYLLALSAGGNVLWRAYAGQPVPSDLGADSRGQAVTLDADGQVLAAFTTVGGTSVLNREPLNLNQSIGSILTGAYQNSYGGGGGPKASFVGRYNADTGALLDATFFHAIVNGKTNSTEIKSLRADRANRVYLAGATACCLELTADAFDSSYATYEGFFSLLDPQMSSLAYSSYVGSAGEDGFAAMSLSKGRVALGGFAGGSGLQQLNPFQAYGGGTDGLLAVLEPSADLRLAFAGPGQTIGAGQPSAAFVVKLEDSYTGTTRPAPATYNLHLSSSSPTGSFAATVGGPYSAELNLSFGAGSNSVSFFYKDTLPGNPVLTVTPTPSNLSVLSQAQTIVGLVGDKAALEFQATQLGELPPAGPFTLSWRGPGAVGWSLASIVYGSGATDWLEVGGTSGSPLPQTLSLRPKTVPASANYPATFSATVTFKDTAGYDTTTVLNVTYTVQGAVLRFISDPQKISAGQESGAFVVEVQAAADGKPIKLAGSGLTLALSDAPASSGLFRVTSGGSPVNNVAISVGSSRTRFYYRPDAAGDRIIGVAAPGLNPVSQPLSVASACPALVPPVAVNNSGDDLSSDPCRVTLRLALTLENSITFAPGLNRVILDGPLAVGAGKAIDGGCLDGVPHIILDGGFKPGPAGQALLNLSGGAELRGLRVLNLAGPGLKLTSNSGSGPNKLHCLQILR